ncbi:hypothetical protein CsSME_00008829 [Camellia sinensis var. sinensis]
MVMMKKMKKLKKPELWRNSIGSTNHYRKLL